MVSVPNLITHVLCLTDDNISDPTPDNTVPTDAQQQVLNDLASEQRLSETLASQTAEIVGDENVESGARSMYRHYITGKNHHHSRIRCLQSIFPRAPTLLYNRRAEIPASRHGQTRYFWAHK